MKSFVKVGAILALSVMVVSAFAQGGGGGGRGGRGGFGQGRMGMGGGVNAMQLLNRKDVQTELKITADQKTKMDAAIDRLREERRAAMQNGGFQDMTQEERQKMMETNQANEKKAMESVLTKEQVTRLNELVIQRAGNSAILRPEVQKELAITDEQKKKIADLQTKQREAMQQAFSGMQDMSREERQEAMTKMRESIQKNEKVMNDELGKILTADQAAKLKAMGGAPFKFDPAEDNARRGGGGRGGRGGF